MIKPYSNKEKTKIWLINVGFKIYKRCDERARDILDEARASGNLTLKGDDVNDQLRTKLVEQIIELIATESIPEKTNRKFPLLNDISLCIRTERETPASFASKFKSLTAEYSVQIGHIDHNARCRMALMMIQNVRLQPFVQSNMVIQLSGNVNKNEHRLTSYTMSKTVVQSFIEYVREYNKDLDPE